MGITRVEYDRLVRKRKKCRTSGGSCVETRGGQGATPPPVAADPEVSAFLHPAQRLPASMFTSATNVGHYTQRLTDLTNEIAGVQMDLADYQARIDGGSHVGLCQFIQEGNSIVAGLTRLHDRTSQQKTMHSHLNLNDLQLLYDHAVAHVDRHGGNHPPSHPRNPTSYTSRTAIIEALTSEYAFEPMDLLQYYHQLQNAPLGPQPPPPPPPP